MPAATSSSSASHSVEFTFTKDPEPLACFADESVISGDGERFADQLRKWGFSLSHATATDAHDSPQSDAPATTTVLARYRYSAGASSLHFHGGLIPDLLRCLFSSPCVRESLPWCTAGEEAHVVRFTPLTCRWTSMQPLEDILVDGKIVRRLRAVGESAASSLAPGHSDSPRLVLVKRPEQYLANDVCIADELRALCLLTETTSSAGGNGDDDDDDEDDDWSGSALSRRALRAVVPVEFGNEFLYRCVRALATGGGALNQYEDYLDPYLAAARVLYRTCVTSLDVRATVTPVDGKGNNETAKKRAETGVAALDDGDNGALGCDESSSSGLMYDPTVLSHVLDITQIGACRLSANPSTRQAQEPVRFCFVSVNPVEQTVVLWSHQSTA